MASQIITVDNLIAEVRSCLDEDNRQSVRDDLDILPALNRGQNYASNILARHYESPMLIHKDVTTTASQQEYKIPEDAFEQRLEKVEVKVNGFFYPMDRLSYRDISLYEYGNSSTSSIPYHYTVIGTNYRVLPKASGAYPLRIWYLKDPLRLVPSQGRINVVNTTDNYLIVDAAGDDLTTESDLLDSYINIIDAQTGERKATVQVKNINGNRINIKTTPARSSVLNLDIDTSLDTANLLVNQGTVGESVTINPDDYISLIHGSCVPFFKQPFSNFLIQYAVAELTRKLGGSGDAEQAVLKKLEDQVERSWVGRESTLKVARKNSNWDLPIRRYYGQRS